MESMAARKELNGISGLMKGFQADRTVYATRVIQTDMGIYTIHIDTYITLVAVNMIVNPSYSTNATLLTVILALVLIV
jgi:arginine deiminase